MQDLFFVGPLDASAERLAEELPKIAENMVTGAENTARGATYMASKNSIMILMHHPIIFTVLIIVFILSLIVIRRYLKRNFILQIKTTDKDIRIKQCLGLVYPPRKKFRLEYRNIFMIRNMTEKD